MAELKRKEEELTTADLAGRNEKPQLVRKQEEIENEAAARPDTRDAVVEDSARPLGTREPVPIDSGAQRAPQLPLFSETEVNESRSRWGTIQTAFVDEPRRAVEDADSLVASLMKKLAEGFASEREKLEKQWDRGEDVSTEDLRIALQRYRSFFDRLLKA